MPLPFPMSLYADESQSSDGSKVSRQLCNELCDTPSKKARTDPTTTSLMQRHTARTITAYDPDTGGVSNGGWGGDQQTNLCGVAQLVSSTDAVDPLFCHEVPGFPVCVCVCVCCVCVCVCHGVCVGGCFV